MKQVYTKKDLTNALNVQVELIGNKKILTIGFYRSHGYIKKLFIDNLYDFTKNNINMRNHIIIDDFKIDIEKYDIDSRTNLMNNLF